MFTVIKEAFAILPAQTLRPQSGSEAKGLDHVSPTKIREVHFKYIFERKFQFW